MRKNNIAWGYEIFKLGIMYIIILYVFHLNVTDTNEV